MWILAYMCIFSLFILLQLLKRLGLLIFGRFWEFWIAPFSDPISHRVHASILNFSRSKVVGTYDYKNYKNTRSRGESIIPVIWMFLDLFPSDEDVEEDSETVDNIVELIHLVLFHPTSPSMDA